MGSSLATASRGPTSRVYPALRRRKYIVSDITLRVVVKKNICNAFTVSERMVWGGLYLILVLVCISSRRLVPDNILPFRFYSL